MLHFPTPEIPEAGFPPNHEPGGRKPCRLDDRNVNTQHSFKKLPLEKRSEILRSFFEISSSKRRGCR